MKIRLADGITIDTRCHRYMGADVDRHGNARVFVRLHGRKTRIRDWSSVEAFMGEYKAFLAGPVPKENRPIPAAPQSFRWLVERYYQSADYVTLEDSTRKVRRRLLDRLCEKHGTKPYGPMEHRHVVDWRDAKVRAGAPEAGNSLVKVLRSLFGWAVDAGHAEHNPALTVKRINTGTMGHHTWTVGEVEQFEDRHPVGTKARLALALMLYTGVRASDAIQLGRQLEREGRLHFTEFKDRKDKQGQKVVRYQRPILGLEARAGIEPTYKDLQSSA